MSKESFDKMRVEMWVSGTVNKDKFGGYCAHLLSHIGGSNYSKTLAGYGVNSTVTRMTLKAVLEGLKLIKNKCFIHIYTGIPQVSVGLNKHIHVWAKNDFKRKNGGDLEHEDLWRQIHDLLETKVFSYKVHYLSTSPIPENNVRVVHTASEYAMKSHRTFMDVQIS